MPHFQGQHDKPDPLPALVAELKAGLAALTERVAALEAVILAPEPAEGADPDPETSDHD